MSCMEQGVAYSQPSDTVAFMTMAGGERVTCTVASILVKFIF